MKAMTPPKDRSAPIGIDESPVAHAFAELVDVVRAANLPGELADYIPELAKADPDLFGVSAASVFGRTYVAGDAAAGFTIQSISKAFVFALVVDHLGIDEVRHHVGVEPSGQAFNEISFDGTGRPDNPMINLGAITTTSLVPATNADDRFEVIRSGLSSFAGRDLSLDQATYVSEKSTGDRNVALTHLARANGMITTSVEDAVDPYFRQCSVTVTATDLAVMAGTLANGGVNPMTSERIVSVSAARHTVAVMASSGMYDRSGEWLVDVGMPAKSGVGGGILAVSPGRFGIGVFSPPLDEVGNSVRGVEALKRLSREYGLHIFDRPAVALSPVEYIEWDDDGGRIIVNLRGQLDFVAIERVATDISTALGRHQAKLVVLDLESVTYVRPAAKRFLGAISDRVEDLGYRVEIDDPDGLLSE